MIYIFKHLPKIKHETVAVMILEADNNIMWLISRVRVCIIARILANTETILDATIACT